MEKLKTEQVKGIIDALRGAGLSVGLRDVTYAVLSEIGFSERALAFRAVFGDSPEVPLDEYGALEKSVRTASAVREALYSGSGSRGEEITFDELKSGLIDDLRALEKLRDSVDGDGNPVLDAKEMAAVVARITDIRVKLTEKFNTTETVVEQRVEVLQKYSDICPYCHREISLPTSSDDKKGLF